MTDVRITSINQSGGITAQNVHLGGLARHLTEENKSQIRTLIPKKQKVAVCAALGDGESYSYAQEVKDFLHAEGYDVEGVNQCVWMPAIKGQGIVNSKEPWEIQIGHHPG